MKNNNTIKTILIWLPSVIIVLFYIPNAIYKIMNADQMDKIVKNNVVLILTGIFLLIAVIFFLHNKTILIGALLLSLYMTMITLIHIYKGKPYELAILIVMATVFSAYIRAPQLFLNKSD